MRFKRELPPVSGTYWAIFPSGAPMPEPVFLEYDADGRISVARIGYGDADEQVPADTALWGDSWEPPDVEVGPELLDWSSAHPLLHCVYRDGERE